MELVEFLLARIVEDERRALATSGQPWSATVPGMVHADGGFRIKSRYVASVEHDEDRAHIARWDPARVLAECEAKRRIVEWAGRYEDAVADYPDLPRLDGARNAAIMALRFLALPYADHEDYRQEWRP